MIDFIDFYIEYPTHPSYVPNRLGEDDIIRVIIQKYELILFTNQGEVLGEPNFGGNLEELLFETSVSADFVKRQLNDQIQRYIPEIVNVQYVLDVVFAQDPGNYQDIMFINFQIQDYKVFAQIGAIYGTD
jgi:hypothetical protein